ncbi:hypothetical protein EZV62_016474 [Acer yangbiense]|uniref:MalT-like TPR region domain-containing protein n=1 Tax=Acer yangbiense TaxID=1000413 RepID=A0A5C7HPF5_9ROSI|nr:hypothetical protein EZV62_016474 [Acer yangbiense]
MILNAIKLSRSTTPLSRTIRFPGPIFNGYVSPPLRLLHDETSINGPNSNPVVLQMINYALSHARSQKSGESYGQGLLVLEQCLSTQPSEGQCAENWRGIALLAIGNFSEAIEKLQRAENLKQSSLGVRVTAMEAIVGLHLQSGEDDTSSVVADNCLGLLRRFKPESGGGDYSMVKARTNAVKGLVELIHGDIESAESCFKEFQENEICNGSAALSYGEYLHATRNYSLAKEFYRKVIEVLAEKKDFSDLNALGSCNMALEEVSLAANFALGQLEAHMGNFADAEEILTRALTKTEELFGSNHPKVGVVLTCLALMFRNKAAQERSSAILIQEGLYRRALEFLKAPPLESEGEETKIERRDIVALARGIYLNIIIDECVCHAYHKECKSYLTGMLLLKKYRSFRIAVSQHASLCCCGYAETLSVQQNRKGEGEKMKRWAEAAWRNRRMSLAEALDFSAPSNKVLVIDGRTSRAI